MYLSNQNEKLIRKFIEQNFQELNSNSIKTKIATWDKNPDRIFEEIGKLKAIVENNQFSKINPSKFGAYIEKELAETEFKIFEKKILSSRVRTEENFARVILDYLGDDYIQKKDLIKRFFSGKYFYTSEKSLLKLLNEVSTKIKLEKLESKLKNKDPKSGKTAIEDLDKMTGVEFENFLKTFFERRGFKVTTTKISNDQGCDLILQKLGEKTSVQAKRYVGTIGNDAIQQVVASLKYYKCDIALVITTSKYTKAAEKLAEANHVELWDREALKKKLKE
ncbi:restriction endonuclease [Aquiflexum gelatinilyticum]|uniref:Restriction endonuclease n=1 Tax=Aquiflexum gelatinilyticum TaxID=2961943 RepID=A0A9X2T296_9BACT|nr:restriction endonuclease [Aquiflexum gelatinilyticum]MCR9016611.1 restriction endonuclease [Aquiflexum gelatinilyticum]